MKTVLKNRLQEQITEQICKTFFITLNFTIFVEHIEIAEFYNVFFLNI